MLWPTYYQSLYLDSPGTYSERGPPSGFFSARRRLRAVRSFFLSNGLCFIHIMHIAGASVTFLIGLCLFLPWLPGTNFLLYRHQKCMLIFFLFAVGQNIAAEAKNLVIKSSPSSDEVLRISSDGILSIRVRPIL
jgi:hypothetical protein